MKATELMIGDWVFYNPNVFIEDEYEPTKEWRITQISNGEDINLAVEECYKPIPLTPEILEKNGFRYDNSPFIQGWCGYGLLIYNGRVTVGQNVSMECQYVHQLQHILRLCGLNEVADNFKI